MAAVSLKSPKISYEPPKLPEYLKTVYDLKPIVGVPSDEEVKGIHTVIRAAYNASNVPGMFDSVLSMHLSQHLFEVQMARYRDKYPFSMFSGDTVYTPPALSSYVPITLQPVVGAPSDNELLDVHAAVRAYEHFANVPSIFNPQVSMELSQHLCNIQIARFMQQVALGQSGVTYLQSRSRGKEPSRPSETTRVERNTLGAERSAKPAEAGVGSARETQPGSNAALTNNSSWLPFGPPEFAQLSVQVAGALVEDQPGSPTRNESDRLLEKLVETMEDVKRVLIGTQRSFARGARDSHNKDTWTYGALGKYEMINDKGERPTDYDLPLISRNSSWNWNLTATSVNDEQLARYLQFYGIGQDLLESGDVPTLKDGKRTDAVTVLLKFLD